MSIQILNLNDNVTVPYSLLLLRGRVSPVGQFDNCTVALCDLRSAEEETEWPVIRGLFVAYFDLKLGTNILHFSCSGCNGKKMRVIYKTPEVDRFIRPVYIVCKEDEGTFQAPLGMDNSVSGACERICLAARMIQTFTAETLLSQGLGRKTFRLESDDHGLPLCRVFRTELTRTAAQSMSGKQLWKYLGCELLMSKLPEKELCKFFAFMSFTEYNNPDRVLPKTYSAVLELTKGHTALGGGGLALFGTGCFYTWPQKITEIIPSFTDTHPVDTIHFMDDSAGRGELWACYSTSLGAACHELGHTFDLGHDPEGIMARGFDDMVRFFTFPQLLNSRHRKNQLSDGSFSNQNIHCHISPREKDDNLNFQFSWNQRHGLKEEIQAVDLSGSGNDFGKAFWHRSSSVLLSFHRWFNPCHGLRNGIHIQKWMVIAEYPLRIIQFRDGGGMLVGFYEFPNNEPDVLSFHLRQCFSILSGIEKKSLSIVIEDDAGNILKTDKLICN